MFCDVTKVGLLIMQRLMIDDDFPVKHTAL